MAHLHLGRYKWQVEVLYISDGGKVVLSSLEYCSKCRRHRIRKEVSNGKGL